MIGHAARISILCKTWNPGETALDAAKKSKVSGELSAHEVAQVAWRGAIGSVRKASPTRSRNASVSREPAAPPEAVVVKEEEAQPPRGTEEAPSGSPRNAWHRTKSHFTSGSSGTLPVRFGGEQVFSDHAEGAYYYDTISGKMVPFEASPDKVRWNETPDRPTPTSPTQAYRDKIEMEAMAKRIAELEDQVKNATAIVPPVSKPKKGGWGGVKKALGGEILGTGRPLTSLRAIGFRDMRGDIQTDDMYTRIKVKEKAESLDENSKLRLSLLQDILITIAGLGVEEAGVGRCFFKMMNNFIWAKENMAFKKHFDNLRHFDTNTSIEVS